MKCPNCLSTMRCISEIHQVPAQPWKSRMNLHCVKPVGGCEASCFMGVITEDPKEWVCHEYRFSFTHNGKTYVLRSYDHMVDFRHQNFFRDVIARTILSSFKMGDNIFVAHNNVCVVQLIERKSPKFEA